MKCLSRSAVVLVACFALMHTVAQDKLSVQETGSIRIDEDVLQKELRGIDGLDKYTLGVDLLEQSAARVILGDDTALAGRHLDLARWPVLHKDSGNVPAAEPYWIRFPLAPSAELKGVPLALNIIARAPIDLYLNGVEVLRAAQRPLGNTGPLTTTPEDFHPLVVQITFACDGRPEMLAIRVHGVVVDSPVRRPVHLVLQSEQNHHVASSLTSHFSLFIGVNLIIALIAFITWMQDRRKRNWSLLVMMALLTAFGALCHLGGPLGLLGFSSSLSMMMHRAMPIVFAWRMVVLMLVLRDLRGDPIRRYIRRWVGPVLALTVVIVAISLIARSVDMSWVRWPLTILQLVIFIGLFVDVVRSAIRLMRQRGLEQWLAIGALTFTPITVISQALESSKVTSSWLNVTTSYLFYLSLSVCVAIYMALRAARNNRLVARQRDELDLEVHERTAQLRSERDRSEGLLLNILPSEVAEELKNTGAAQARHFDTATILFTDFKGFTAMSEKVTPKDLVRDLNECFSAFDKITSTYGIEKIKTIGDAYMAAGGLPVPNTTHATDVINAALEMRDFVATGKARKVAAGLPYFEVRIGIHTGPVVAGIVGVKKFQYDIWGDTVNTASRMESSGEVGQVNISEATYALVKNSPGFTFIPRGKVSAKGKGELEMYFVRRSSEGA